MAEFFICEKCESLQERSANDHLDCVPEGFEIRRSVIEHYGLCALNAQRRRKPLMSEMIETYRGEALAWEADELGHMNMRYYFAKSAQARAAFFGQLHLPSAFKARALSTLVATRQHIKYHKEVRPGVGMAIKTGILSLSETDIVLVHMITQSPQKLAATVVETLSHISVRTGRAFAWPKRVHEHGCWFYRGHAARRRAAKC